MWKGSIPKAEGGDTIVKGGEGRGLGSAGGPVGGGGGVGGKLE